MTAIKTCGWADCDACKAMVAFAGRYASGEITNRPVVTSPWWESEEAEQLYRKGVNLPPCHHPKGVSSGEPARGLLRHPRRHSRP